MGTSLSIIEKAADPMQALAQAGTMLYKSGILGLTSPEQGFVVCHTCEAEGITFFEFGQRYHIIEGKPTKKYDRMLAEFITGWEGKHRVIERSPEAVEIELTDRKGQVLKTRLTWEDCQKEPWPWKDARDKSKGLKTNWATPIARQNMMFARCVSMGIRHLCPQVNAGIYTPEEIMDADFTVGPVATAPAAEPPKSFSQVVTVAAEPVQPVQAAEVIEAEFEPAKRENEPISGDTLRGPGGFADLADAQEILKLCEAMGLNDNLAAALKERGAAQPADLMHQDAKEMLEKLQTAKKQFDATR